MGDPKIIKTLRPDGIDRYEQVSVTWVPGADPTLTLFDNLEQVLETADLEEKSFDGMHQLFEKEYGLVKSPEAGPPEFDEL